MESYIPPIHTWESEVGEIGIIVAGDDTLVDDGNSSPFVLDDI